MSKNMQTLILLLAAIILTVGVLARLFWGNSDHQGNPAQAPAQGEQPASPQAPQ